MNSLDKTAAVLIVITLILLSGATIVYNLGLWIDIQKLTTPLEEAPRAAQQTHSYFLQRGEITDPVIDGFNEKELSHMRDVKQVIQKLEALLILSLFALLAIGRRSTHKAEVLFKSSAAVIIAGIALLIIPFNTLFIKFHEVFFEQGTWTFDSGLMVQAFPFPFFVWMAQLWWIRLVAASAIICLLSFFYMKKQKPKNISAQ